MQPVPKIFQQRSPINLSPKKEVSLREKLLAHVKSHEVVDVLAIDTAPDKAFIIAATESFVLKRKETSTRNHISNKIKIITERLVQGKDLDVLTHQNIQSLLS